MKIMFVCTGNTCRSAMAEAIFKKMVDSSVEVYSSGTISVSGKSPSKNTVEVCKSHGIDVSNHKSTYFRDSCIAEMDLVLTFERTHRHRIEIHYPDLNVCTIRQFIGEYPPDIPDPFGGDYNVYENCYLEICRALEKVKLRLDGDE